MAQRLTDAEKMEIIEKFVAENRKGFYHVKSLQRAFTYCSGDTLGKWVKNLYGKTTSEFFKQRGVLATTPADCYEVANKILNLLKAAYADKEPESDPGNLSQNNPDIPVEDFSTMSDYVKGFEFDAGKFFTEGILKDPFTSAENVKKFAEYSLGLKANHQFFSVKSMIRKIDWENYSMCLGHSWVAYAFGKFPEALGMTAEEYFIKNKLLLPADKAQKEVDKCIQKIAETYASKEPENGRYGIEFNSKKHTVEELIEYYTDKAMESGLDPEAADAVAIQVFIDAGIIKGEKSADAKPVVIKKEEPKVSIVKEKTDIYNDIDRFDAAELAKKAGLGSDGVTNFPKDHKYTVKLNGKDFFVKFKLNKTIGRVDENENRGFDGKEALLTMLSREEVVAELNKQDPNHGSDAHVWATAEFKREFISSEDLTKRRFLFLKAIGAMLSKQEVADAIVEFAPKKKNGTFHKGKIVRIASSMVARYPNEVYEIIGRTDSDDTISIAFEKAVVTPENFEKSMDDFISNNWNFFNA